MSDQRLDRWKVARLDRHARIELHGEQVVLRDLGSYDGSVVNGERVRDALLATGDQVVFDAHHRFVVEAPARTAAVATAAAAQDRQIDADLAGNERRLSAGSLWRLPWLLVAAVLLAAALAALFWFGPK